MNNPAAPFLTFPECGYPDVQGMRNGRKKKKNPNTAFGKQQRKKANSLDKEKHVSTAETKNGCLTPASDKWELSTD